MHAAADYSSRPITTAPVRCHPKDLTLLIGLIVATISVSLAMAIGIGLTVVCCIYRCRKVQKGTYV